MSLENDKIYQLEMILICSEISYVCSGSSNSTTKTWYRFMDCDTWLASKNFSILNLGHGPPGRGLVGRWPTGWEPLDQRVMVLIHLD